MKDSKYYLPRKLLALVLSFALAATWMIPSSLAVYADDSEENQQEVAQNDSDIQDTVSEDGDVSESISNESDESVNENEDVINEKFDNDITDDTGDENGDDEGGETPEEPAEFAYDSGSGTAEDPGVISDADTLEAFADEVDEGNHVSDFVKLGADIDLSEIENWNPIGAESGRSNVFNGEFDGSGYAVSGLTINEYDSSWMNCGLFSTLGGQAKVHDLEVKDANIVVDVPEAAMYARAGVISGWVLGGSASISDVKTSGQISLNSNGTSTYAGGIIGNMLAGASIINGAADVDITVNEAGDSWAITAGGIAASAGNSSVVANCASLGDVTLTSEKAAGTIGGAAGVAAGVVANTYVSGAVSYNGAETDYAGALIGQLSNGTGALAADDLYYASDVTELNAAGTVEPSDITVNAEAVAQADMAGEAFADTMNGNLKNTYRTLGGSAALKQWVAADGKVVPSGDDYEYTEEMSNTTIGGLTYFYADTEGALDNAVYKAVVKGRKTDTTYTFSKSDLTQVGDTSYYYAVPTGTEPLTGTLYGYGEGKAATYKSVYGDLGIETDDSYDAITSATKFTGHHAKDIPSLVTYGVNEAGEKFINGLTLERAVVEVDATAYVEASILKAAGEEITDEQEVLVNTALKVNPMTAPSADKIPVTVKTAEWTSSKYGIGEFAIVPDDTVEGYVWSEYWGSVYAATVSNGDTTVGAVHWIDLYGEAATSGPHYNKLQLALNNGTSIASNEAEVNRYAAFFDSHNNLKAGTYTIKVYAEGYETLTAVVEVPQTAGYVLMNIPYDEFYNTEVAGDVPGYDAVTGATPDKKRNFDLANGSYHTDADSEGIEGAVYPVYVPDLDAFKAAAAAAGGREVKDDEALEIVMKVKGQEKIMNLSGKEVLFEAPAYSYYVLSEEPAAYKDLTISEDGVFSFSEAKGEKKAGEATAVVNTGGHHTDYELIMTADEITAAPSVSGVVITADGKKYGLAQVVHIWRKTDLGWDNEGAYAELGGKTVTNVTYYTSEGTYSFDVNVYIPAQADVTVAFKDAKTLKIEGMPADAKNVQVTACIVDGRNRSGYLTGEGASVTAAADGTVALLEEAVIDQKYTVTITSDNYRFGSYDATYSKAQDDESAAQTAAASTAAASKITSDNYTAASYKAVATAKKALDEAIKGGDASEIREAAAALDKAVANAKVKSKATVKKVSPLKKNYSAKKLKKKAQKFTLKATVSSKAKASFKKVSGNKKITVAKTGKVTVKKGLKKGTYKVKVKVTAPATANAKDAAKTVTLVIKVK